jgi:adenine-specific DNA-methyltransferase
VYRLLYADRGPPYDPLVAVAIRYMGAKHGLAPKVAKIMADLPAGPCLDLFAGMCSVAGALSDEGRAAWCNDVQWYATTVATALVATNEPPDAATITSTVAPFFESNRTALRTRFDEALDDEARIVRRGYRKQYESFVESWSHAGNDDGIAREFADLRQADDGFPFRLATLAYANGYFGVAQSIDLDSLLYGISEAASQGLLDEAGRRWGLVALLQTASRIAATTGHFAEYLHPHQARTFRRIRLMRRRDVLTQWKLELGRITPYGERDWRVGNRVYNGDAVTTLAGLEAGDRPTVVYADPPYSRAQYSRYYHVLETLVLYDYPELTGAGRYRSGRYQTPFSHAASVEEAFKSLIGAVADATASLVLSYPTNGLLYERGISPAKLMRERFGSVRLAGHSQISHSTLGGASGVASHKVREMIFVGRQPN